MNIDLANLSLSLEEEDEEGFEVKAGVGKEARRKVELCLIGKVLTDKSIHFISFRDRMASLWRSGKGVTISDLKNDLFIFQFYHVMDLKRVLVGGPWSFDNNLVMLHALCEGEDPCQVKLTMADFWIQIHDIPVGYMTENLGRQLGNFIGEFREYDTNNDVGVWRKYMRIRVGVDITKPLKRKKMFRKQGGDNVTVNFKYERLPLFCFVCGRLGHGEKFCSFVFDHPEITEEKG